MTSKIEIRKVAQQDEMSWRELWNAYLRFYRHRLPDDITALTFKRLIDPSSDMHGFVAESGGATVGFVHYLYHGSTWSKSPVCYLEDLFVTSIARGLGAGRALISAVYAAADSDGAQSVYWMTQEYNADGRALYDTLARRTSFIKYER